MTGEWRYGYLYRIDLPNGLATMILTTDNLHSDNSIEPRYHLAFTLGVDLFLVRPETVGSFINVRDNKGDEIYEGDIIYSEFGDGSNTKCLVGWDGEKACFGIMDEYAYRSKTEGYDFPKFDSDVLFNFRKHGVKFEVIGNIHDNPKLLTYHTLTADDVYKIKDNFQKRH